MTFHGLMLFCLVYLLATASPGPGIAAILARVLSRGAHGIAAFIAGFVVGDLVWFTFAATGMAALAQSAHALFLALKYAGALYLLYLAYRLWTAPIEPFPEKLVQHPQRSSQLFWGALALTLGNPKPMVFFLALLPTVIDLTRLTMPDFMTVAVAICVILSAVLGIYVLVALRARRFFRSPQAMRWWNRGAGTAMAGAAATVAAR